MTIITQSLYEDAIHAIQKSSLLSNTDKKNAPKNFIVATHGPALAKAIVENPNVLDMIGIYRVNCSHIGKEPDLKSLADLIRAIAPHVPILIDLQGPKPRIHEMRLNSGDEIEVTIGRKFQISFAENNDPDRFCTETHLKVCFPEIIEVMEIGDTAVFDDGKMTATVTEIHEDYNVIECTEIAGNKPIYMLKGRKGICVRNKPLGIDCITEHDRISIEFAKNILGFEFVDNIMVSYFLHAGHIRDFVRIMGEYGYTGNLGGKFETPNAVANIDEILATGKLQLAMFGRGDLRVEMDIRAIPNMHKIQAHFFSICNKYEVESICATGFLESMIVPEGGVLPEEIGDMQISMRTGPDHLMLSGESTYGAQAAKSVEIECMYQRDTWLKMQKNEVTPLLPEGNLSELLFITGSLK